MVPKSDTIAFCLSHRTYSSRALVTASFFVRCPPSLRAFSISLSSKSRFVATRASTFVFRQPSILHKRMCGQEESRLRANASGTEKSREYQEKTVLGAQDGKS